MTRTPGERGPGAGVIQVVAFPPGRSGDDSRPVRRQKPSAQRRGVAAVSDDRRSLRKEPTTQATADADPRERSNGHSTAANGVTVETGSGPAANEGRVATSTATHRECWCAGPSLAGPARRSLSTSPTHRNQRARRRTAGDGSGEPARLRRWRRGPDSRPRCEYALRLGWFGRGGADHTALTAARRRGGDQKGRYVRFLTNAARGFQRFLHSRSEVREAIGMGEAMSSHPAP